MPVIFTPITMDEVGEDVVYYYNGNSYCYDSLKQKLIDEHYTAEHAEKIIEDVQLKYF